MRILPLHISVLLTVLSAFTFAAAARAETESRSVAVFESVALEGKGRLEIVVGKAQSLELDGDIETLKDLKTEVRDGTLYIGHEDRSFWSFGSRKRGAFVARITVPHFTAAAIAGSGDIAATGVDGDDVRFSIAGSGNIKAVGRAKTLRLVISGSGDADLPDLAVEDAKVIISGSGDVTVNARNQLDAIVSGHGDVVYLGTPAQVNRRISGSGTVRQKI